MKTRTLLLLALVIIGLASCGPEDGPRARFYPAERTTEEMLNVILDAMANNTFYYTGEQELYYLEDGKWYFYGTRPRYGNPMVPRNDPHYDLPWIGLSDYAPTMVSSTNKYGYSFVVRYFGRELYF